MTRNELESLIAAYGDDIFGFCCHLTGSRDQAEELYQDTFLKVTELCEQLKALDGDPDGLLKARNYCLGAALYAYRNHYRRERYRKTLPLYNEAGDVLSEPAAPESTEETVLKQEERLRLRKAVRELPDRLREAVYLCYYADLTMAEAAKILKVPAGTVKSRLNAAKKKLKKALE